MTLTDDRLNRLPARAGNQRAPPATGRASGGGFVPQPRVEFGQMPRVRLEFRRATCRGKRSGARAPSDIGAQPSRSLRSASTWSWKVCSRLLSPRQRRFSSVTSRLQCGSTSVWSPEMNDDLRHRLARRVALLDDAELFLLLGGGRRTARVSTRSPALRLCQKSRGPPGCVRASGRCRRRWRTARAPAGRRRRPDDRCRSARKRRDQPLAVAQCSTAGASLRFKPRPT